MEVTRKNFKEVLPMVQQSIKAADFLVIDTEFTGLMHGRDVSMFDSPQEYYLRLLNGTSEFLLMQFGLCTFYWDEKEKEYKNEAYNFYLFPRGRPGPERMFLCQSSSLDFLAAQGFDFNKVIKDGISYMTEPTETRLRDNLTERQKLYSNEKNNITIPDDQKQYIEDICKKVRQFLDEKKSDEMEIDRCNAFVRRLLFQELGAKFKNEAFVETKILENKNRILQVTRITSENMGRDKELMKKEREWEEFDDAIGFSKVARMISESEKLIIGHNMLLDVLHTLNHFFQPLNSDYNAFKEFTHCMFPRLLDTKYMSSLPPFKVKVTSSVLQHLYSTLTEPPFKMPAVDSLENRGYSQTDDKHHEAGYDAYVTGLCFLSMYSHLASMRGEVNIRVKNDSAILKPFINKLFLAKTAPQDSSYINLTGKDPTPSREHVFHMTFPKDWQRTEINQLFSPYGPVTVQFLDETSALVALSRREQTRDVFRALSKSKSVSLLSYNKYKSLQTQSQSDKQWRKSEPETTYISSPVAAMKRQASTPKQYIPEKINRGSMLPEKVNRTSLLLEDKISELSEKLDNSQSLKSKSVDLEKVDRQRDEVAIQQETDKDRLTAKERPRSKSVSTPKPRRSERKRTSSGMFQVDDSEPPPKKPESFKSMIMNGKEKEVQKKENVTDKKFVKNNDVTLKVIETFRSEPKCVKAFKESDSWD